MTKDGKSDRRTAAGYAPLPAPRYTRLCCRLPAQARRYVRGRRRRCRLDARLRGYRGQIPMGKIYAEVVQLTRAGPSSSRLWLWLWARCMERLCGKVGAARPTAWCLHAAHSLATRRLRGGSRLTAHRPGLASGFALLCACCVLCARTSRSCCRPLVFRVAPFQMRALPLHRVRAVSRPTHPKMGVNSISFGSPRVRSMGVHCTCGEPNEIKKHTHPKCIAALSRAQGRRGVEQTQDVRRGARGGQHKRRQCFSGGYFFLISFGGQAPHVLRAHMGMHTCGEPNEIELTAAHRLFYRPLFRPRPSTLTRKTRKTRSQTATNLTNLPTTRPARQWPSHLALFDVRGCAGVLAFGVPLCPLCPHHVKKKSAVGAVALALACTSRTTAPAHTRTGHSLLVPLSVRLTPCVPRLAAPVPQVPSAGRQPRQRPRGGGGCGGRPQGREHRARDGAALAGGVRTACMRTCSVARACVARGWHAMA